MKTRKIKYFFSVSYWSFTSGLVFMLVIHCFPVRGSDIPPLIPFPQNVTWEQGNFTLKNALFFQFNISPADQLIKETRELLSSCGVNDLRDEPFGTKEGRKGVFRFSLTGIPSTISSEEYQLQVLPHEVKLEAGSLAGLYRGVQTLKQLVVRNKGKIYIQCCRIIDWPAFEIRGFMQDVGRNYMPVPLLKEQIDVMAAYKYNVLHFHVTDNPGWRLESLRYPQLKDVSSMSRWKGKYYSISDFLELVSYCHERHIILIPELDIPGHSEAFRKAFTIDSMADPRVQPILTDLIDELCELVPAEKMPYIHLGTDEVRNKKELPAPGLLETLMKRISMHHREVMVWRPGQQVEIDHASITQLWSSNGRPRAGHRYIDSRLNYLNHLDPLAGIPQLFFDRICGASQGDSLRLGGILCCWNDNLVADPADILRQNPVYPGLLTYSESLWKGLDPDPGEEYLAKFPSPEDQFYRRFVDFEERLVAHRDLWFKGKPFPYVRQSDAVWNLIGPFDNGGDVNRSFPVEESMKENYLIDGKQYSWQGPFFGGTIHIRHFFGYPSWFSEKNGTVYAETKLWAPSAREYSFWIGFHDWSRSGGRRGGPFPQQGQWHKTNPMVWVNWKEISPPVWNNPGLPEKSDEIPFTDENYFFREPVRISLKKGWNQVLIKIPQDGSSWKWMFTFIPILRINNGIHEDERLKFKSKSKLQG